jgi:hypothetical protein
LAEIAQFHVDHGQLRQRVMLVHRMFTDPKRQIMETENTFGVSLALTESAVRSKNTFILILEFDTFFRRWCNKEIWS